MPRIPSLSVATPNPAANIPELINRREFLKRVAGSAGTAALSGPVVSRVVGGAAEAASPYMDDLSGFTGIRLSPFSQGSGDMFLEVPEPASWWDNVASPEAADEYEKLRREIFAASNKRPVSPLQIVDTTRAPAPAETFTLPYEWNRKTGQWHAAVYDPVSRKSQFLAHGSSPPPDATYPWWSDPADTMEYGGSYYGKTPVEITSAMHDDYARGLARSISESGIDKKAMRENRHYANEARRQMDEKGLAPGGRYEQPPVLADSGDLTGNFGLVGGEALPPDDPQPKRMWSRSPSGLNRAASGAALSAFLLAPLLSLQQQQENR